MENTDTKTRLSSVHPETCQTTALLESAPKSKKRSIWISLPNSANNNKRPTSDESSDIAPDKIIHHPTRRPPTTRLSRRSIVQKANRSTTGSANLGPHHMGTLASYHQHQHRTSATQPEPPIQPVQPTIITTTISPLFLQRLSELPGAIAELSASPQSGYIHAYIPKTNKRPSLAYINKKQTHMPIHWRHCVPGKTRDALIWHGNLKQS